MIRPVEPPDHDTLAGHGFPCQESGCTVVEECDGAIMGAANIADRPFETETLGIETRHLEAISAWDKSIGAIGQLAGDVLEMLRRQGVALVTCRPPESERAELDALQSSGFNAIECLMTLARDLAPDIVTSPPQVTIASMNDAEGVAAIGASAFRYDRFHADPRIDNAAADRLKAAWARNSVTGRADTVFVTRDRGRVTGFNACLFRDGEAVIDLIGVSPGAQGNGLGRALTEAALAHYGGKAKRLVVGTQSGNHASLALYQGLGFRVEASAFTLHAHLS